MSTTRFDENSDVSTTYLGRVDMTRASKIKAEETFLISEQGYSVGNYRMKQNARYHMDTGASRSFMSKSHYFHCKSLHLLPKFASKTHKIEVGNGQFISVLLIIPIVVDIHGHRFEIYMLVIRNS